VKKSHLKKGVLGVPGVPETVSLLKSVFCQENLKIKIITKRCSRDKNGMPVNKSTRACERKTFTTTSVVVQTSPRPFLTILNILNQFYKGVRNEPKYYRFKK
jgi:hypothetical protein